MHCSPLYPTGGGSWSNRCEPTGQPQNQQGGHRHEEQHARCSDQWFADRKRNCQVEDQHAIVQSASHEDAVGDRG